MSAEKIRINHRWYSSENYQQLLGLHDEEPWTVPLVEFLGNWYNSKSYIEVKTSGSTGEPGIIRLPKESMAHSARMTCRYFNLNEESTALLCLPADYIAGKMMIVRAIVSGFNLIPVKPSADPFRDLHEIIDFAAITPYQFVNSYQSILESPVRNIIIGGSQVSLHLQKLMENLEIRFYETYGMTETCSHVALRRLNGRNTSEYFEVLPGIKIRVDDRGCLVINAPALTEKELVTNDVVELKDASHFRWLGRFDHVINTGGIKIFPEQVEKKIEPYLGSRFFIGALPDEKLNQKVVLVIEGQPLSPPDETTLKNNMESVLDRFERPRQIIYRQVFEVSSSGKILKNRIMEEVGRGCF